MRGFEIGSAGREREREGGDHRIARPGDVDRRIRPVDWYVPRGRPAPPSGGRFRALEDGHAVLAAGHDERIDRQIAHGLLTELLELCNIGAHARLVSRFELALV